MGTKCSKCTNNYNYTTEEWIELARKKHDNEYDYSKVIYENKNSEVIIICKIHGEFTQTASHHLNDCCKCPKCVNHHHYTTEEWIEKAKEKHGNKYDYSKVEYINAITNIIIICPINNHNEFSQKPSNHICGHISGCPKCFKSHSKSSIQWLNFIANSENINIQHAENGGEFKIPTTKYKADGYCQENNTIYEYYGCYWHACAVCYDANKIHTVCKKLNSELHNKTIKKENIVKSLGYNLITIWEHDWKTCNKNLIPYLTLLDLEEVDYNDI